MVVNDLIKKCQALEPKRVRGVNLYNMKKEELIRRIQRLETNSSECFNTDVSANCGQTDCCWYKDCKRAYANSQS